MGQTASVNFGFSPGEKPYRTNVASIASHLDLNSALKRKAASIQGSEPFSDIPVADRMAIVANAQEKQYVRRHTLYYEGDPVRQVVLLLSGCLKISQLGTNGQEVILRLNGPGDVLGGIGRCAKCEHCSTARTMEATSALVWDSNDFEGILERYPLLRRNIAHLIERQLNELEVRFREVSTEKVGARLSSQLIRLVSQVGRHMEGGVEIALSRRELAQLTGTTLFTVSRLLSQWEDDGILEARREAVLIRDVAALKLLSREE